jgi:hypothetical protein
MKKALLGALLLVPLMQAYALAQEPTADAKEGRFYIEGGLGFGVASMAADGGSSKGFNAEPLFDFGLAAEYGITDRIGVFTRFGVGLLLHDDPGVLAIGMTFDGAYKLVEKKGDVPALSAYAGLGFVNIDVDPKNGKSDDATDFVFETGIQMDWGTSEDLSIQPFMGFQVVAGSRPFKGYNGMLQVVAGVKALYKLSDNLYLEPSITFLGGNFQDQVVFGIGIQLRL